MLATWSGECETVAAFVIAIDGESAATTVDGRAGLGDAAGSAGVGWTPEGRAIVHFGTRLCGSALDDPGVHLVDPTSLDRTLVISQSEPGPRVHRWRLEASGNDAERIFVAAIDDLGLQSCCGEPSHGGDALTAGASWQGFDIPIGASPADDPPAVPFNDLVLSSEPIEVDGAPTVRGEADLGPFVAFTCGDRVWTVGGAGLGDRATPEAVTSLAFALLPHLGCTVGPRPLATGHGSRGL